MVIGCLAELMAACPAAIDPYFEHFFKVLVQNSKVNDGQMVRNVSYGVGILCQKGAQKFEPNLMQALQMVQNMYTMTDAQDAKDNCIACIIRILD